MTDNSNTGEIISARFGYFQKKLVPSGYKVLVISSCTPLGQPSVHEEMTRLTEKVVLVTGASGYIASHCIRELLELGYRVRGTVRDIKSSDKVDPIKKLDKQNRLELVETNLDSDDGWDKAVSGCTYILHIASPISLNPNETYMKTAVDGALRVLKAANKESSVRKIVMTSSTVASTEGHAQPKEIYDETIWSDAQSPKADFYSKSKTLAEKAAWDYVANIKDGNKFALTTIQPSFVTGPSLLVEEKSSVGLIKSLFSMPAVPKLSIPCVDVRDVAHAHILAMTNSSSDGERIIISSEPKWFSDLGKIIKGEFGPQGYKLATAEIPNFVICFAGLFSAQARSIKDKLSVETKTDNSKSKRLLGMSYRDVNDSIIEMVYALIEKGSIKKTSKYNGVPARFQIL